MAWNDYLSIFKSGLAASLPTSVDHPEIPQSYYATDTGQEYVWNTKTLAWDINNLAQLVSATGQTQGSAAAVSAKTVIVTAFATATHNGIRLPAAVTNLIMTIVSGVAAGGFKVYPAPGGKIGAAVTNAADSTNLGALKSNTYIGVNKTLWAVVRGS